MRSTEKYREKYKPKDALFGARRPAGHDDIHRLCDAVDRLTQVIEDAILDLGPEDKFFMDQKLRGKMNMILMGL